MFKRFCKTVLAASLGFALHACTPPLTGGCQTDAECKPDETCASGLCLKRSSSRADAGPDGGLASSRLEGGGLGSGELMQSQNYRLNGTLGGVGAGAASTATHRVVDSMSGKQGSKQ